MARILLVEDEAILAIAIEMSLVDEGHEVLSVVTAASAILEFDKRPEDFDCVFTDIRLPGGIDGWDIANHVRERRPDIPVIYATGDSAADWRVRGVEGSVLLQKPFALDSATSMVEQMLRAA